ncbi:hypothetical protein SBY92_002349 [Candida maltosa Xu316]|uniref:PI31 proteasome regulator C-terminal domain-containing protein n=1 Tax=Candida maltosa (strain Xu316) TaxID=1245528 RepID=M3JB34_CANMX|nr:hypothetical protein G210_5892 [Candida maltosa Xu316]
MAINNYFQLTFYLVSKYVNHIYPTSENFKLVQFTDDSKLKQSKLYRGDEQLLILSFTEISEIQSLVNLLNIDGRLDNALINWEWFDLETINFPIEESKIPPDLIEKFNTKFRLIVDDEKVSSIFSHATGPIIEEHTDSESLRSPTPETPYVPDQTTNAPPPPVCKPDNSIFQSGIEKEVPNWKRPADMPDFDDEYEIKSPPAPVHDTLGRSKVTPIGSDDLNPPGIPAHPTLKPYLDPLQNPQHQGMYPTPDHPLFGQQKPPDGSGFGAPPGARFDDPFGPPGGSGSGFGGPPGF